MAEAQPRLHLWGVTTSRTLRAVWALHELSLDYVAHPILPRTGETKTARVHAHQSAPEDPRPAGRRFHHRREPGHHRLSLRYLRHRRQQAGPARWQAARDVAGMVLPHRHGARRDEPLRHAPPPRPEAHLRRSAGRRRKRQPVLRDPAPPRRPRPRRRPALPRRRAIHQRRHAAHDLPRLGDQLRRARAADLQRLRRPHRRPARLPGSLARQPPPPPPATEKHHA